MENLIELKFIKDILGMNFYIPGYQRGYRWTEQQVKDLLNDVNDFNENDGFYCLQPLVVKKRENDIFNKIKNDAKDLEDIERILKGSWEVIDGQQRLTSIAVILKYCGVKNLYSLEYETRRDSSSFLNNIEDDKRNLNIDYYHIVAAKQAVNLWFQNEGKNVSKTDLAAKFLNNVKFIWYESVNEDPIKVFTRLNIGKIGLTNAELIKALFLNSSNFGEIDINSLRLKQKEIAIEWDNIEYTLQNEEFWLFLNEKGYDKPTRIDMIFEQIYKSDMMGLKVGASPEKLVEINRNIGNDEYQTFRYFLESFKNHDNIQKCWLEVKHIFDIYSEWFKDLELYHYIGFLISCGTSKSNLLDKWFEELQTKETFVKYLKENIATKIKNVKSLSRQYELEHCPKKTECRPLLLLHNIQTVINQSKNSQKEYGQHVFYKFPFHLYKLEDWDVEHIDSSTLNTLNAEADKREYLKYSLLDSNIQQSDLAQYIKDYLDKKEGALDFDKLKEKIENVVNNDNPLNENEKNQIRNFVLLDSGTNRGYGNSIFPVKRKCIIGKDQGQMYQIEFVNGNLSISSKEGNSSFIPPCTKYAFLKYYNSASASINYWDVNDANEYCKHIKETLKDFGITD
ncbi:MAG: DUF262 domain-containing protein [Bacteroidaceae bacterium]|nr:DUF262 domain-containing protein [Bacteroidaceae bacterium]